MSEIIPYEFRSGRFSTAPWMPMSKSISLIGVGGIGSYCAYFLSRMSSARIDMYDNDVVEEINLSGQLYGKREIGIHKVEAMCSTIFNYSNFLNIKAYPFKYTEEPLREIVLCGLDNMEARKNVFEQFVKQDSAKILIDGRLAAEELQVYCITKDNPQLIEKYKEEALFSDEEADSTICSYKQTSHMAAMIASIMTTLVTNYVVNFNHNGVLVRDLPYFSSFDAVTFNLKTI